LLLLVVVLVELEKAQVVVVGLAVIGQAQDCLSQQEPHTP
jgi:hypothetical protein